MDPIVTGAAIGAVGNAVGGLFDNLFYKRNLKLQTEAQQQLMATQQAYNEQNMATQNEYMVDQWNRENAYNDPSAVRARYEAAGISPQAAFGQGSASGSGIAGGLSSAPSGGSPSGSASAPLGNQFAGLGSAIAQGMAIDSQNKLRKQQEELAAAQTKEKWLDAKRKESVYTDDYFTAERLSALSSSERSTAEAAISKLRLARENGLKAYYDVLNAAEARERVAAADLAEKHVATQMQIIENLQKDGIIKDVEADKMRAEVTTEGAKYDEAMARAKQLRALAKVAKADRELKSEQARKICHEIIQGYISSGASATRAVADIASMLRSFFDSGQSNKTAWRIVKYFLQEKSD